ncbi:MAG: hypothetical protein KKE00_03570, partial [Proteobacteria bacterium]|nr:hypothetical protein [Pseudomonadota bacterium]
LLHVQAALYCKTDLQASPKSGSESGIEYLNVIGLLVRIGSVKSISKKLQKYGMYPTPFPIYILMNVTNIILMYAACSALASDICG